MSNTHCNFCASTLPGGCHHMAGRYAECPLGPRTDTAWLVGMAVWKDLTDRRGIKNELEACEYSIQAEIVETIGRIAVAEYERVRPAGLGGND